MADLTETELSALEEYLKAAETGGSVATIVFTESCIDHIPSLIAAARERDELRAQLGFIGATDDFLERVNNAENAALRRRLKAAQSAGLMRLWSIMHIGSISFRHRDGSWWTRSERLRGMRLLRHYADKFAIAATESKGETK